MKSLPLLAVLLASCAGAPGPAVVAEGPIVEVRQSFTCPLPASRGLITIPRSGAAERIVFDTLEVETKMKTTRETMQLAPKDTAALFNLVANSDWRTMPDGAGTFGPPGTRGCPDCCSGALYIKTAEGGRSLAYSNPDRPAKLDALLKGIDAILARGTWARAYYPWEKPAP